MFFIPLLIGAGATCLGLRKKDKAVQKVGESWQNNTPKLQEIGPLEHKAEEK